jgi:hypothetical protein
VEPIAPLASPNVIAPARSTAAQPMAAEPEQQRLAPAAQPVAAEAAPRERALPAQPAPEPGDQLGASGLEQLSSTRTLRSRERPRADGVQRPRAAGSGSGEGLEVGSDLRALRRAPKLRIDVEDPWQ